VSIGAHKELEESSTARETNAAGATQFELLVVESSGHSIIPLPDGGALTIGRAEGCEVQLRDPLASRNHGTLQLSPLVITDHGSANGTLLAGRALDPGESAPVQPGQAISIGNTLLLVRRRPVNAERPARASSGTRLRAARPRIVVDPAMCELHQLVERLAQGSINILILGETGVGKELVAETIHELSPRRAGPLVRVNCAAFAEQLLESELFGHERGAFTGAVSAKPGLLELAHGGTMLLDEVADLPPMLQPKLLRVIEAREVTRVGALRPRPIDVRFVSATNGSLELAVERGLFRRDLMFRLNGAAIDVPPLRARPLEIVPLAELFLAQVAVQTTHATAPRLSPHAIQCLLDYDWPGNVRELRNAIERAALLSSSPNIEAHDLALGLSERARKSSEPPAASPEAAEPKADAGGERDRIADALLQCGGNQSRAAKLLDMPRRTLVRKIALFGLPRPHRGSD
jgi:transcriptional regulator with PAS, ATPase and Fis domain